MDDANVAVAGWLELAIVVDPPHELPHRAVQRLLDYLAPVKATPVAEGFHCRTGSGPAVGIRAELDALEVQVDGGGSSSRTTEIRHVRGHDGHMAALALVTGVLRSVDLGCSLVSVIQPREEAPSSARSTCREKVGSGSWVCRRWSGCTCNRCFPRGSSRLHPAR